MKDKMKSTSYRLTVVLLVLQNKKFLLRVLEFYWWYWYRYSYAAKVRYSYRASSNQIQYKGISSVYVKTNLITHK